MMKNIFLLLVTAVVLFSCKNDTKEVKEEVSNETTETVEKSEPIYTGDFLAVGEDAIFTIGNDNYKVIINDVCKELIEKSKSYQETEYDFVRISVKGDVAENPNKDEWGKTITFKSVERIIKINTKKNITIVN